MSDMTSARASGRARGDSGAAVVEAGLALPVLLWLVLMLVDFGVMELKQTQVSSAARDGARTGIVAWNGADSGAYNGGACTPSTFAGVCKAINDRLAGTAIDSISVRCYGGQTNTAKACSPATIRPGVDTMVVSVATTFRPSSIISQQLLGTSRAITSSARMVVQ